MSNILVSEGLDRLNVLIDHAFSRVPACAQQSHPEAHKGITNLPKLLRQCGLAGIFCVIAQTAKGAWAFVRASNSNLVSKAMAPFSLGRITLCLEAVRDCLMFTSCAFSHNFSCVLFFTRLFQTSYRCQEEVLFVFWVLLDIGCLIGPETKGDIRFVKLAKLQVLQPHRLTFEASREV